MRPGTHRRLSRPVIIFTLLLPFFAMVSIQASSLIDARTTDFGRYWQAAEMNLHGEYVYDQDEWAHNALWPGLDAGFNYPFPLVILLAPIGLFPIQSAYAAWIFLAQCSLVISVIVYLGLYQNRKPYFELITIGAIFLFRPTYTIVLSGQLDTFLLLCITLFLFFSKKNLWFWGGFVLSLISLKPSFGFPILALTGPWFLFHKNWRAIAGNSLGALSLLLLGMASHPIWVTDYLSVGQKTFQKYSEISTTVWGLASLVTHDGGWRIAIGSMLAVPIIIAGFYLLARKVARGDAFSATAIVIPISLLIAPYAWAYDQILLIVSIIFTASGISQHWDDTRAAIFYVTLDMLAVVLVGMAYFLGHDVWSVLIPFIVLCSVVYLIGRPNETSITYVS